jgi:hypothetical protein
MDSPAGLVDRKSLTVKRRFTNNRQKSETNYIKAQTFHCKQPLAKNASLNYCYFTLLWLNKQAIFVKFKEKPET